MISTSVIVLGSYVNFSLYAPAILGAGYEQAKVLGILDYDSANALIPAAQLHASVYPTLPPGTPNDYTAYPYLKILTASGTKTAVGLPWIQDSSYVVNQAAKMTIVLDSVDPDDQNKVTQALNAIGLSNFTITLSAPVAPTPSPAPSPTPAAPTPSPTPTTPSPTPTAPTPTPAPSPAPTPTAPTPTPAPSPAPTPTAPTPSPTPTP